MAAESARSGNWMSVARLGIERRAGGERAECEAVRLVRDGNRNGAVGQLRVLPIGSLSEAHFCACTDR